MEAFKIILKRFIFFLGTTVVLSVIAMTANDMGIVATHESIGYMLCFSVLAFAVINFLLLRREYSRLREKRLYFAFSLVAAAAFILVLGILFLVLPSNIFVWLFAITRFLSYSRFDLSNALSLSCFFAVAALTVPLAPIGKYRHRHHHRHHSNQERHR